MLLEPLVYWVPWLKDATQRQRAQPPTSPAMLCSKQFCVCLKIPKVFPEGRLCSFLLPPLAASKSHEAILSFWSHPSNQGLQQLPRRQAGSRCCASPLPPASQALLSTNPTCPPIKGTGYLTNPAQNDAH